ncbi:MAG TPA: toll/interleukin-1 receptor domain-containing protein, partial [Steroidobacteraceae bacterium]|nr:toll/interleukin-1 receptor domain-containing protein [Steroidobacteraceae bacterium]
MPDVFLSYSREDQVVARRFADALEREGFSVWWDQTLSVGDAYDKVTERALGEARAVLVLWSKRSVDSRWVRAEATMADRNGRLVPVMIEPCNRPIMFELTQTADLSHWDGAAGDPAWQSLLGSIRRFVGGQGNAAQAASPDAMPAASTNRNKSTKWRLPLWLA